MKKNHNPEQLIKNDILAWLIANGAFVWPNHSIGIFDPVKKIYRKNRAKFYKQGVSDILGIWKDRPLAIEVKSLVGRPTEHQIKFLEEFNANGGIGFVANSLDQVIERLMNV